MGDPTGGQGSTTTGDEGVSVGMEDDVVRARVEVVRARVKALRSYALQHNVDIDAVDPGILALEDILEKLPLFAVSERPTRQPQRRKRWDIQPSDDQPQVFAPPESPPRVDTPNEAGTRSFAAQRPTGMGARRQEHVDAWGSLSLGDVLPAASPATRVAAESSMRTAGQPNDAVTSSSAIVYDEGRGAWDRPSPHTRGLEGARGCRGERTSDFTMSLGDTLSTSRRPDLRARLRNTEPQDLEGRNVVSNFPRLDRDPRSNNAFSGSLTDILPRRDFQAEEVRRRFIRGGVAWEDEGGATTREDGRSIARAPPSNGTQDTPTPSASYEIDRSIANRALCRMSRVRHCDGGSRDSEADGQTECSICLEEFRNGQVLAAFATGCKHRFHQSCIVQWFVHGKDIRCPLCRFDPITGTW